ncbi:MAG: septal ring lytic transglycosylase RlpA family protein [Candidatus Kapabacteria bacterium]|nr:septal ring lytic transglycosylase RlpA family protein [Candidatus Kapabacteria bacterium]
MRILILNLLFISLFGCSSGIRFSSTINDYTKNSKFSKQASDVVIGAKFYGKASYYADSFNGKMTANGEIFLNNAMTAAHKELAFGTLLSVKNLNSGKTATVRVNDRGPFVGDRIIDLSKAAAIEIEMLSQGVAEVEITVIGFEK